MEQIFFSKSSIQNIFYENYKYLSKIFLSKLTNIFMVFSFTRLYIIIFIR